MNKKILIISILSMIPCISVAHDYYTSSAISAGVSKNTFSAWQEAVSKGNIINRSFSSIKKEVLNDYKDGSLNSLPILASSDGAVVYPYHETIPVLQTAKMHITLIKLTKGFMPMSFSGLPRYLWESKEMMVGKTPVLEVMPIFNHLSSSVQIVGTNSSGSMINYTINLVSSDRNYTPELSFYHVNHTETTIEKFTKKNNKVLQNFSPEVNSQDVDINWDVHCTVGDCSSIRPVSVANSKKATFITLKSDKKPLILTSKKDGQSYYDKSTMQKNTLILEGVPHKIDLIDNVNSNISQISITKRGS